MNKFKCSMQKKKESLGKKSEANVINLLDDEELTKSIEGIYRDAWKECCDSADEQEKPYYESSEWYIEEFTPMTVESTQKSMYDYVAGGKYSMPGNFKQIDMDWDHDHEGGIKFSDLKKKLLAGTQDKDTEEFSHWGIDWFFDAFGTFGLEYNFKDALTDSVYDDMREDGVVESKKKEAKKSEATYNPDKVKADEMRLDYLSGVDDFYDGIKKYGFDVKDRGYYGSGKDGVYYRTIWLMDGKRKSGPNTNHTIKIGYDTNENTPFVAIDQYVLGSVKDLLTVIDDNFAPKTMEALAKKSESKKSEGVYGTIRVDSEDIAIKVQESNVYPSSSGRSLSVEVPNVEAWFSTLSEFSDCIDGLAENCNGYPDISRDGSDILVQINAPKEDESDDYEVIVELRCSTEITSTSLEGVVDILNHD